MKKYYTESRNKGDILHAVKRRKDKWICHTSHRYCPPKYIIEGKMEGRIEMTGSEEDDVSSYWTTF